MPFGREVPRSGSAQENLFLEVVSQRSCGSVLVGTSKG